MPLREDCLETGIIRAANAGKEGICVEFVYSPEENLADTYNELNK